ncbi:hypothetical conserved protein [Candidatus Nitrosoglobus terrae]|uniref:Hypothetical conserved protein n=1 Tax=Candidatus Nitrosoglobus terrae TaxID=1630141 RepID=A0A1Q2SMK4_9GAMM|nr:hypothetical protein [Candidatus Nitrosoglobus terrae]BAW80352.1 hypothetical conserved protein [Candidatus Nitrosoglobus terrae]
MKQFGIYITLQANDTMRAPHLLGDGWDSYRWYQTAEARDKAFEHMQWKLPYYQRGDNPNYILTKINK